MIYLKSSVGIEMGQEDLLVSCLRSNFAGGVFTSFLRIPGYRQLTAEEVRNRLDGFFKRERVGRANVVLGVPRKDVILRYLDLPREVEDNLKQVVFFQVQTFEPTEEEKLYYDFVPIRNGPSGKKLHVLLLMIRKSILDAHLQYMRQLGIRPASITVGAVALANMFLGTQHDGRNKTFILADLKAAGFELAILRGGTVIYTHEGARQGGAPWKQVLQQEMEIGISKVRLDPEETIEGIIVAGESSPGALQEIGEDLPGCEPIGKRLRFEMTLQNRGHLQEAATSLGLAYSGLSRRPPMKLNLLPPDQRVQQKTWAYIPTVILGLALVAALGGLVLHKSIQERMLVQELDRAVDGLKGQVDHIKALRLQAEDQERQVASLEQVLGRRDQNLEILLELTNMFPADTYLQMYNNNDCSITITGQTPPAAQFDFISKLEKSPLLRDVSSTSATFRNQQSGKDVFTFTAKCEK